MNQTLPNWLRLHMIASLNDSLNSKFIMVAYIEWELEHENRPGFFWWYMIIWCVLNDEFNLFVAAWLALSPGIR